MDPPFANSSSFDVSGKSDSALETQPAAHSFVIVLLELTIIIKVILISRSFELSKIYVCIHLH